MLISYFLGQRYYPVSYDLKRLGLYSLLTAGIYVVQLALREVLLEESVYLVLLANTLLILLFVGVIYRYEVPAGAIAILRKKLLRR